MAESFGYWQMIDPRHSIEEGMDIILDIFEHGLVSVGPTNQEPVTAEGPSGQVEDSTGKKTLLRDISIDGQHALRGRMGDAEAEVDLKKLVKARFQEECGRQLAVLTAEDGQQIEIEVDAQLQLSGTVSFGSIRIPLKRIVSVRFGEG
jgi:hypothetical protein